MLVFWLGTILCIIAVLVAIIACELGNILFIRAILTLSLLGFHGLGYSLAITLNSSGPGIISLNVIMTHDRASFSIFSLFSNCLLFFSPSSLGVHFVNWRGISFGL